MYKNMIRAYDNDYKNYRQPVIRAAWSRGNFDYHLINYLYLLITT